MVKTTINLDTEVYRELFKEAIKKYGTTKALSKLINEKLKGVIKKGRSSGSIVERSAGTWTGKETGLQYTRRIRREMEKRVKEILHEE
ncbi:MAG: hypothetical protein KGH57_00120 [Candidatus Micrarchaeota archaeon]|nr:hypothetical protein [Candidatus Micrarchaeota archaeon]